MPPEIQQGRSDDGYKPFQLIGVIVIALLGFAVFFLSFLLAPLAILALFYVGFATSDRNKRDGNGNGKDHDDGAPHVVIVEQEPAPVVVRTETTPLVRPPGAPGEPRPVPPIMVSPGPHPR